MPKNTGALEVPKGKFEVNRELFDSYIETDDEQNRSRSKKKLIMVRRNSPNTKNMSFIQAKDSFLQDREEQMGIKKEDSKDDIIDYEEPIFLKNLKEQKKNPQDDDFDRDEGVDLFKKKSIREDLIDSPDIFKKLQKRESEANKMNPFSLAKIFNPSLDEMDNIENLLYDEKEARTSHEAPKQEEINAFKRRETKLFKDLR